MEDVYSVSLSEVIREHKLEAIYLPMEAERIQICSTQVNRPGLPLVGFLTILKKQD